MALTLVALSVHSKLIGFSLKGSEFGQNLVDELGHGFRRTCKTRMNAGAGVWSETRSSKLDGDSAGVPFEKCSWKQPRILFARGP